MERKIEKSWSELKRAKRAYLRPQIEPLFNAYARSNEMSDSKAMNVILRMFFAGMKAEDRQRMLQYNKDADANG
jgi:hypothetical protein